jgi:uncharacterized protein YbaR (Trm112 family)
MSLDKELLDILVCPQCKGELEYKEVDFRLICHNCKLAYKIEDDIPIMLPDQAEKI